MTKTTWFFTGVLVLTFFSTAAQAQNTDSESAKSSTEVIKNDLEPEIVPPFPNPASEKITIDVMTYKNSSYTFQGCSVSSVLGEFLFQIPVGNPKSEDDEVKFYSYKFNFAEKGLKQEGLYFVECKYLGEDQLTAGKAFRVVYTP